MLRLRDVNAAAHRAHARATISTAAVAALPGCGQPARPCGGAMRGLHV